MKKIRVSAKNVQKAIEEGLKELKATQEEVDIKIIDEGGLFKKATVELTLDKEVEEQRQKELEEENKSLNTISKEKNSDEKLKSKESKTKSLEDKNHNETSSLLSNKAENSNNTNNENNKSNNVINKDDKKERSKTCYVITGKDEIELGTNFLKELFSKMNVEAEISAIKQENGITFNASGDKVSTLIGKRGETLNAIQDILGNVLKNNGYRETRFYFDVENYKNRREISLVNLAERMASKALKIKKPIKLERMSAYERKIIHSALQSFEGVSTHSEGEDPNRYLIIIPTKDEN